MTDERMNEGTMEDDREARPGPRIVGIIPDDAVVKDKTPETPPKKTRSDKGKKRPKEGKVRLTHDDLTKALAALGGKASAADLVNHIYGKDTPAFRQRVQSRLRTMGDMGIVKLEGHQAGRVYVLPQEEMAKASSNTGVGDLFEMVGLLGDTKLVRSMDTLQVFKLEAL